MKIVILGNSNSILSDGWLPTFKKLRPTDQFFNLSIGGSPSPALLYSALSNKAALDGADFAIIEPTVIDHGESWQSPENIAGQADALISFLICHNVTPVLLVMPREAQYVNSPSKGMLAWTYIAEQHGVSVILSSLQITKFANQNKLALTELYRDNRGHLVAEVQGLIGMAVAGFFDQVAIHKPKKNINFNFSAPRYIDSLSIAASNGLTCRTASSSLLNVNLVSLYAGDIFQIEIEPNEAILGIAVNYGEADPSQSIAILACGPDVADTIKIDLKNTFLAAGASRRLVIMFCPMKLPLGYSKMQIENSKQNKRLFRGSDQCLENAGFLVGTPIAPISKWRS
jgi:hypothetical protein